MIDELGVKKDTIKFTYTKPSDDRSRILENDYVNLVEEKTTAKLEFTNKTVRADDQKKITESFNDWVHYALVYQKSHVIVMVSRLTELGFCKKSNTKPTIFTFLADDWADVDRHSARFKEIESLV